MDRYEMYVHAFVCKGSERMAWHNQHSVAFWEFG